MACRRRNAGVLVLFSLAITFLIISNYFSSSGSLPVIVANLIISNSFLTCLKKYCSITTLFSSSSSSATFRTDCDKYSASTFCLVQCSRLQRLTPPLCPTIRRAFHVCLLFKRCSQYSRVTIHHKRTSKKVLPRFSCSMITSAATFSNELYIRSLFVKLWLENCTATTFSLLFICINKAPKQYFQAAVQERLFVCNRKSQNRGFLMESFKSQKEPFSSSPQTNFALSVFSTWIGAVISKSPRTNLWLKQ